MNTLTYSSILVLNGSILIFNHIGNQMPILIDIAQTPINTTQTNTVSSSTNVEPTSSKIIDNSELLPTNTTNQPLIVVKDKEGKSLFYQSFDKKTSRIIKIQYAMVLPANFDPKTYNKDVSLLLHDGVDKKEIIEWDPTVDKLNYTNKNTQRTAVEIANKGTIVFIPTFRGEGESEGNSSIFAGDVQDTISLMNFINTPLPKSEFIISGSSRGVGPAVLAAQFDKRVKKLVLAYGVTNFKKWCTLEAKNACNPEEYPSYKSWNEILDEKTLSNVKDLFNGKVPEFNRNLIEIKKFANKNISVYIQQGFGDTSVRPYHALQFYTSLKSKKINTVIDFTDFVHKDDKSSHGFATRLTDNFISLNLTKANKDFSSLSAIQIRQRFVDEASSSTPTKQTKEYPISILTKKLQFDFAK
jgi:hypothetical protein